MCQKPVLCLYSILLYVAFLKDKAMAENKLLVSWSAQGHDLSGLSEGGMQVELWLPTVESVLYNLNYGKIW